MKPNYIKKKDGDITFYESDESCPKYEKLQADIYKLKIAATLMGTFYYFREYKQQDKLIEFTTGKVAETIQYISTFLSDKTVNLYKEMNIMHKLGIILYGPPGTGKTSTVNLIMKSVALQYDCICLNATGIHLAYIMSAVEMIRKVQSNPIVIFVDEVDGQIENHEDQYLSFLDGESSFNNLIFIGCTNYIEEIPERIKNRKSRIKHLIEIKSFPTTVYNKFITERSCGKLKDKQIEKLSYLSEEAGLTLDQVKHVLIDHIIEEIPLDEAIKGVEILKEEL